MSKQISRQSPPTLLPSKTALAPGRSVAIISVPREHVVEDRRKADVAYAYAAFGEADFNAGHHVAEPGWARLPHERRPEAEEYLVALPHPRVNATDCKEAVRGHSDYVVVGQRAEGPIEGP